MVNNYPNVILLLLLVLLVCICMCVFFMEEKVHLGPLHTSPVAEW